MDAPAPARLRKLPTWLLGQAALAGDRRVNEELAAEGVRKYHFRVLVALSEHGPLSQADLGRRLHIDRSDMVAVVGELEASGFIGRERDPDDRRRNVVSLTPEGEAGLARMDAAVKRAQAELLAPLSAKERRELTRLLDLVVSGAARPRR
jgi:DNA-binding MarR family transcriptional regulator